MNVRRRYDDTGSLAALAVLVALLGAGCTGIVQDSGDSGGSVRNGGGSGGKGANQSADCAGWEIAMPKRVVRLSFNQVAASLRPIFGDAFADEMITTHDIADPTERTFPPLGDTREGSSYIDAKWQTADAIAQAAGQYAFDDFAVFSACGDAPSAACGQTFVSDLAARAYRRPLSERERTSLLQVFSEVQTAGGSVQEAVQFGVYAIFSAPHFLYRTELGADLDSEGPLTPYETASQISYFITDGPPDQALLDAAAVDALATPEELGPHVDRLLALPASRLNLEAAIFASLGAGRVLNVVIDPGKVPADVFNAGVAASMYREAQLFIQSTLWKGKVPDLVTSRSSFIDQNLAALYQVPAPTSGLDADGFGLVELPSNRAGLLTMAAFLTSRSRPDTQSVVGRGLAVNDAVLCQQNPAFPEDLASAIEEISAGQKDMTEREKAEYRGSTTPCNGCHSSFDAYGIALENFDLVGRFRTTDDQGRSIDASVILPPVVGGQTAQNPVEVGTALASSGAFSACVVTKLLTYALAETGVTGNSCATKVVAERFAASDQSFSALVREVAVSKTLTHRSGG
jgi:hypothetical protein